MTEKDSISSWYSQLSRTYTTEQRQNWYSGSAVAYDRVRPRYPQTIIDRALEAAQLPTDAHILELGCGPGIATVELAKRGFSLVCLEPSPAACELALANCSSYPHVEIIQTTFENWELQPQQFDAVIATTSFHWMSPDIRCLKASLALKQNGSLILLWNTPPQPSDEIHQKLIDVYQIYAPDLAEYQSHDFYRHNLQQFGKEIIDSGLFQGLVNHSCICDVTYTVDEYIALLSTLSPYIKLEPQQRQTLFIALKDRFKQLSKQQLSLSYLSAFHQAYKVT
ncbi:MAG: class I SAM-dependent methyltransferase [Microcoleaceae cyanobacterium]